MLCASARNGDAADFLSRIITCKRSSDDVDAQVLYRTFIFLSSYLCKTGDETSSDRLNKCFQKPRASPSVVASVQTQPVVDRVWNLLKAPELDNAFSLAHAARKLLSISTFEDESAGSLVDANAHVMTENGVFLTRAAIYDATSPVPDGISRHIDRKELKYPDDNKTCLKAEVDRLIAVIDKLFRAEPFPAAAIFQSMAEALSVSVPMDLRLSTARVLVRVARAYCRSGRIPEGLLLLDDVEGPIGVNCSYVDVGMLHQARAELLIALAGTNDERFEIICDALKSTQKAIQAFDQAASKEGLLWAVAVAAALSDKLGSVGMRNFYSVKFLQVKQWDENMTERFFGGENGQPTIPRELSNSPKAKKPPVTTAPMSPPGSSRGIQTLIKWTH